MDKQLRSGWWGLYALLPVTLMLLYAAHMVRVSETLHQILLAAIAIVIAGLALSWIEKHQDLISSEGIDAVAEQDSLGAMGIPAGRLVPSLTARQASYRESCWPGGEMNPTQPAALQSAIRRTCVSRCDTAPR